MDEQIGEYLDRLFAETVDARRSLEERFEKNFDRVLTVLNAQSEALHDLRVKFRALRARLTRVEETIIRAELAAGSWNVKSTSR